MVQKNAKKKVDKKASSKETFFRFNDTRWEYTDAKVPDNEINKNNAVTLTLNEVTHEKEKNPFLS